MQKGSLDLKKEIMDHNLCTKCGLCVGMCPYIKSLDERVVLIHPCGLDEGTCYNVCPKTLTDWELLDKSVFGAKRQDHILGNFKRILFARSLRPELASNGQYGGVTSTLLIQALNQNAVQAAIVTGGLKGKQPNPTVARGQEEVLACAGSHYTANPSLSAFNSAIKDDELTKIAVTGRPCQVLAIRKMQALENYPAAEKVGLVVGLFCFWALETRFYDLLTKKAAGQKILKIDIPVVGMVVTTPTEKITISLEEIKPFIRSTCQECYDPTSEFADVSVGSTEYDMGWNTLIIRTDAGEEIVESAIKAGILETKPYPKDRLPLLYTAVRNKKLRVLQKVVEKSGAEYLKLNYEDAMECIKQGVTG